ncbi:MAG: fibronectin type III domain-containing protein [Acidimicrobiia bacterium]|nr:fibronectin type III domain-containing protein [Acidimicrobiia bacterium]
MDDGPDTLYVHDGSSTGFAFVTVAVGADGLELIDERRDFVQGFDVDVVTESGLLYYGSGDIVEPTQPRIVGSVEGDGHPVAVPGRDRLLMVREDGIGEYHLHEYRLISTLPFDEGHVDDTALAGDTTVVAGDSLVFVPLGADDRTSPGAPVHVGALADDGSAHVFWDAPPPVPGAPVTGYEVTARPGGESCNTAGAESCLVEGLANGTAYTFTVTAANVKGVGPASEPSEPVTPVGPPGVPRSLSVVPGDGQLTVELGSTAGRRGSAVTGYEVDVDPGTADSRADIGDLLHRRRPRQRCSL